MGEKKEKRLTASTKILKFLKAKIKRKVNHPTFFHFSFFLNNDNNINDKLSSAEADK